MAASRSSQLSVPVQVRLSPETHARYAEKAAESGIGVSTYLRQRLEATDPTQELLGTISEELYEIDIRLERLEAPARRSTPRSTEEAPDAVAIETLMLLRSLMTVSGRQQDVQMIRSELKRRGLTSWE